MKEVINNIIKSFNNKTEGFASKKLTAFTVMCCVVAAHAKWIALGDFSQLEMVLTIDFSFVSVLYGINVKDKQMNAINEAKEETK